jgi:opacity protein-like surface antigen
MPSFRSGATCRPRKGLNQDWPETIDHAGGTVMRRIMLLLLSLSFVLGASASLAYSKVRITGIGGHLDYVDPEDIDSVVGFGGILDLGTMMPDLGLEANVDYWSKSYDLPMVADANASFSLLSFGATAKYYFAPEETALRPFAGGGLALHFAQASVDYPGGYYFSGSADENQTKLGIDLCGGALYGVSGKIDLLGELRYRLVSDVNQVVLRAGLIYRMGQ